MDKGITHPAAYADREALEKNLSGSAGSANMEVRRPVGYTQKSGTKQPMFASAARQSTTATEAKRKSEMGDISREELEARLGQNKAEAENIAAQMKVEISEFKSFQSQQFSAMNNTLSEIMAQISQNNGEITGLKGQVDGIKTSMTATQWLVGAVLAMLAVIITLPQIQSYFKVSEPTAKEAASETHDTKIKQ
ncbi:TPA: hypothetical protein ACHIDG_004973 [Escherichia coli]|uniref:hypothetical protein n=1 Tax=Escherichia coli TaxID=562 RepID=UPI00201F708A|nr:hypothetical protein [Escherichia coli]